MSDAPTIPSLPSLPNTSFSTILPGLQIVMDSTSLTLLKECPRKYYYSMIRQKATPVENIHFIFGGLYHRGQEFYHRELIAHGDWPRAVKAAVRHILALSFGWKSFDSHKNRESLISTLIFSFIEWRDDPARTIRLANGKAAVELSFKLPLPWRAPTGEQFILSGHLDRLCEFNSQIWIEDYKTTKTTIHLEWFNKYSPDNQMSCYTAFGKLGLNAEASGVMVNGIQILVGAARFARGFVYRHPSHIDEWIGDLRHYLELAATYAEWEYWPMNDTACDKYGGCQFRSICSKAPAVRELFLNSNYVQKIWDPAIPR